MEAYAKVGEQPKGRRNHLKVVQADNFNFQLAIKKNSIAKYCYLFTIFVKSGFITD
jgi:hypothetical protein